MSVKSQGFRVIKDLSLDHVTIMYLVKLLHKYNGRIYTMAKVMKVTPRRVIRMLEKYEIEIETRVFLKGVLV